MELKDIQQLNLVLNKVLKILKVEELLMELKIGFIVILIQKVNYLKH